MNNLLKKIVVVCRAQSSHERSGDVLSLRVNIEPQQVQTPPPEFRFNRDVATRLLLTYRQNMGGTKNVVFFSSF